MLEPNHPLHGILPNTCRGVHLALSSWILTRRGLAIGLATSGAYAGYGLSYAFIAVVDLIGWRWTYISSGIGGVLFGVLTLLTVKNPYASVKRDSDSIRFSSFRKLLGSLWAEPWTVLLPIFLAFACKMGYQYTISYNLNNYFVEYFPEFPTDVYFSWLLPVTGMIAFILGGFLSDVSGKRFGAIGRLWVIVILELIQIPLYVFFILLDLPINVILGVLGMIFGDGWTGIGLSAIADIVSPTIRTIVYALFFCVMDVIGGCVIVAVSPLTVAIGFRDTLLWLGTGMLAGGTVLILVAILVLAVQNRRRARSYCLAEADLSDRRISKDVANEKSPLLISETTRT